MNSPKNRMESRKRRERRREREMRRKNRTAAGPTHPSGFSARAVQCETAKLFAVNPVAVSGESMADRAVLAASAGTQLDPEDQSAAAAIRTALAALAEGRASAALAAVQGISRGSPLAEWRMFVRGLAAFYADDFVEAARAWKSLDPHRRPHRIAAVLRASEPDAALVVGESTGPPASPAPPDSSPSSATSPPAWLERRAALVRRFRQQRPVLERARHIANVVHRDPDQRFSASQLQELINLRLAWNRLDPGFVQPFERACVYLCTMQPQHQVFDLAKQRIPGPAHDRVWNLLAYVYYQKFRGAESLVRESLRKYLVNDLPHFHELSADLRSAIASTLEYQNAQYLSESYDFPFSLLLREMDPDVESALRRSIQAYPANRAAHQALTDFLQEQIERTPGKPQRAPMEAKLHKAYVAWSLALPEDVPPRLWLIDQYFDNDELARAQPIVESLSGVRLDEPLFKALPWKLKLRQAFAACRRKSSLGQARRLLAEAEGVWPSWLPKTWLPFFLAALERRSGDSAAFAERRAVAAAAVTHDRLLDDVMIFGALKFVQVPSAELRPFRADVEQHAAAASDLSLESLARLGAAFWDLQRVSLFYPGYRSHGSKFGKAFVDRLATLPPSRTLPGLEAACLWAAGSRFWGNPYEPAIPVWLRANAQASPLANLAILRALVAARFGAQRLVQCQPMIDRLAAAAKVHDDSYYRHAMAQTATEAREKLAEYQAVSRFAGSLGLDGDEYADDDEDG